MNTDSDKIWILITRELTNEATSEETKELQEWLATDPLRRELFHSIKSSWADEPGETVYSSFLFDLSSGKKMLRDKIKNQSEKLSPSGHPRLSRKIAIKPSRNHTALVMAAIVLLALSSISIFTSHHFWDKPEAESTVYTTANNEQRIITLPDGSNVRMNRNSRLTVSNDAFRTIHLEGEAFFDIKTDPDHPFKIYIDEAVVEVLGTSFNVKEEGEEIMVAVQEGLVAFNHRDYGRSSVAKLSAGQLGLSSNGGREVKIEDTPVENYMSWMNEYLRIQDMTFDQVMIQLRSEE